MYNDSDTTMIKVFLIAMIFNLQTNSWDFYDKLPILEMPDMQQCLMYQNAYNRRLVQMKSLIRAFCVEKKPDIYY